MVPPFLCVYYYNSLVRDRLYELRVERGQTQLRPGIYAGCPSIMSMRELLNFFGLEVERLYGSSEGYNRAMSGFFSLKRVQCWLTRLETTTDEGELERLVDEIICVLEHRMVEDCSYLHYMLMERKFINAFEMECMAMRFTYALPSAEACFGPQCYSIRHVLGEMFDFNQAVLFPGIDVAKEQWKLYMKMLLFQYLVQRIRMNPCGWPATKTILDMVYLSADEVIRRLASLVHENLVDLSALEFACNRLYCSLICYPNITDNLFPQPVPSVSELGSDV